MMGILLTYIPIKYRIVDPNVNRHFIVLARPWSSLPMMLKFSGMVLCPVWVLCPWMEKGSFRFSLYLPPGSWMFPLYTLHYT